MSKWILRIAAVWLGLLILNFAVSLASLFLPSLNNVLQNFSRPVVAVVYQGQVITSGLTLDELPVHDPDLFDALDGGTWDDVDRWVYVIEDYRDAANSDILEAYDIDPPNLTNPSSITQTFKVNLGVRLGLPPIFVSKRDFVFVHKEHLEKNPSTECAIAELQMLMLGNMDGPEDEACKKAETAGT